VNVPDTVSISFPDMKAEVVAIETQLLEANKLYNSNKQVSISFLENKMPDDLNFEDMAYGEFLMAASVSLVNIRGRILDAQKKYSSVLMYFGEDSELSSEAFFESLHKFGMLLDKTVCEVLFKTATKQSYYSSN
jgi:hypothetical protein